MILMKMRVEQIFEMCDAALLQRGFQVRAKGRAAAIHHHALSAAFQQKAVALGGVEGRQTKQGTAVPVLAGKLVMDFSPRGRKAQQTQQQAHRGRQRAPCQAASHHGSPF